MTILNARWPRDLSPETCIFGRSRNDVAQESPRSRLRTVIRQGRPLWHAECSWSLPNTDRLAQLRYWLDGLEGYSGAVQIWDFASWRPDGLPQTNATVENPRIFWTYLGNRAPFSWAGMPSHWQLDAIVTGVAAGAGSTSVTVQGLTPFGLAIVQGQYVQVGRRLYIAADGASANSAGNAIIPLTTPLLDNIATGIHVRFAEAACEMELTSQSWGASARAGDGFVSISATFRETVTDKN
jgi:hypothetical protein